MTEPYGVPGTLNLLEALRGSMPVNLTMDTGEESPDIKWYLKNQFPQRTGSLDATDLVWPNGVIEVIRSTPINRVRYDKGGKMVPTTQSDVIAYTTGTLSYAVTQEDIDTVTSIIGTVSATPGHIFIPTTDYTLADSDGDGGLDTIVWTGGGTKPDNATNFTVLYKHKMYARLWGMDGRMSARAIIRCKEAIIEGKAYSRELLAETLGDALEMHLRRFSGTPLVKPDPDTPVTLTNTAVLGPVMGAGPVIIDDSNTLAGWSVDFTVRLSRVYADPAVAAILTVATDDSGSNITQ